MPSSAYNPALRPKFFKNMGSRAVFFKLRAAVLTPNDSPCHNSRQFSSKISGYNRGYRTMRQMTAGFLARRGLAETRPVADVEAPVSRREP
jgi:hypothetical protein